MKKDILKFVMLALCMLVSFYAKAHDFGVNGIYYNILTTTEVGVTFRGSSSTEYSNEYTGEVEIPESVTYNGKTYSVTSIGRSAFYYCYGLTSINIPNSVTSIGNSAFGGCTGLASITVDAGNAVYDSRENCNAIIEKKTNSLIFGCKNTTIPNSVTSIRYGAFLRCTDLTSITIPNSVTSIGEQAFAGCTGLTNITIPNSVTSIGDYAFEDCTGLTSINIPNSVANIGLCAFLRCTDLTSITIPNSVTSIGSSAFSGCTGLASITVDAGNAVYDSRENCNAIIEKETNSLISGCKNTTIPNSVTSIGKNAFYGCTGLTSITIPNSVTSIGDWAFYGCKGLTSITIPNSVTSIGEYAFQDCTGLTSITIPNSVTSIAMYAFAGCRGLTSITIPNSVPSIGNSAFLGCTGLTSITLPNSVKSIGNMAFAGCTGLASITIPNSVTSIGNSAFSACNSLSEIYSNMKNPCYRPSGFGSSPTLYVPAGTADKYIEQGWDYYVSEIVEVEIEISNTLSVSDVKVTHGASVILPVSMENEESITAFQFEVSLPEGVSLVGCELTDRKSDQMLSFSELPNGNYQVAALSLTSKAFKDSEGALVNLQLATEKEMEAGEYNVTVKNIELTTTDEDALRPADCTAKLTVTDVMVGDSNGDGKISITDAVAIVNYILNKPSSNFAVEAADVNMDAKVTITDAVAIVNKILAGTTEAKSRAADMQLDPQ